MAVAAEALAYTEQVPFDWQSLEVQFGSYQLADAIPEIAEGRQAVRTHAQYILESRRLALEAARNSADAPPIDALSAAHLVLSARDVHGQASYEYADRQAGLLLDCQRLVGEWYRKLKPEYFKPVRHTFDATTETYVSHGRSITQMTKNALIPIADNDEEERRRVNEYVEEATPQVMRSLGRLSLASTVVRTISGCPEGVREAYLADSQIGKKHTGYGGYVPEIDKRMIRDFRFIDNSSDRLEEQVGLPGNYITDDIIEIALAEKDLKVGGMNRTELHGSQIIAHDDLKSFVAHLDYVASREWCTEIFMGEEVPKGFIKDYDEFWRQADQRAKDLEGLATTVATFVLELAEDEVDPQTAPATVEEFVKLQLLQLGKKDIVIAEQMFDRKTAIGLQEVVYLESLGEYDKANQRMAEVTKAAPGGGYCSGGSCGIEAVSLASKAGKDLAKKLKLEPGEILVKDTERKCPNCHKKKIAYAYSKEKVKKYCDGCKKFESKSSKATPKVDS